MKIEFQWDQGNDVKNYSKHGVSCLEAESLFQDKNRVDFNDIFHSAQEGRFISLGKSSRARLLFAAWTLRTKMIRIISVRPASKSERNVYEEKNKQRTKGT